MLRRAKDRELGLWFGLSTAAARWQPAVVSGRVAREGEGQREAKEQWGGSVRPRAAGAARQAVGGTENRGADWRKKIRDLNAISEIPGTQL